MNLLQESNQGISQEEEGKDDLQDLRTTRHGGLLARTFSEGAFASLGAGSHPPMTVCVDPTLCLDEKSASTII